MRGLSQSSINRQQHIPAHIQQAMNQHMKTMPAHLQRQMGNGIHMSAQTQKAVANHMQKNMPAHLKQYAGAYMEQQVINPRSVAGTGFTPTSTVQPHAPVPDRMRLDHSNVSASQYEARFNTGLFAADQPASPAIQSEAPGGPPPAPQPQFAQTNQPPDPQAGAGGPYNPQYGFIMEPPPPPRRSLLPTDASMPIRIGIMAGGVLVLLILFLVIKGLLSGGGNSVSFISIAQDQQEMIHIVTNTTTPQANQQAELSATNQNFAITAQLSLTSAQRQTLIYLQNNGKKVKAKTLELKISAMTDQELTAAATNSTYDSTFKQIMQSKLTDYQAALKQAYVQTGDPVGRKLLNDEYKASKLLVTQLDSPSS